jgi:hypothetical protein
MTLARDVPLHEGVAGRRRWRHHPPERPDELNRALLDFLAVDFSQ